MSERQDVLRALGLDAKEPLSGARGADWIPRPGGPVVPSVDPATGEVLAEVELASAETYERVRAETEAAFETWRKWPAPKRGEVIRLLGEGLRKHKKELGALVSMEMGKIRAEGEGEVQEMIDICDFAVGLSRQLYGLSMHSERPEHRMFEQWHPLGVVGIISAFNFPVAVWSWNAAIAAVCGNACVWKPSELTPLTALATTRIAAEALEEAGAPPIFGLTVGDGPTVGEAMSADRRVPLVSATGSTRMGRRVHQVVAERLGKCLLELGGNNAVIVMDDATEELVVRGTLFGAVGTAGQRCTTTRRLLLHKSIAPRITQRLLEAYAKVPIGDPLDAATLMGPLVNERAVETMMAALDKVRAQGGEVLCGGERVEGPGFFVTPALVKAPRDLPMLKEETFAPILYLVEHDGVDDAIALNNDVPQGLSSAIFTNDLRSAEAFLSAGGSDCGIANVNIGTSGAEIGGAFGGEKDTGGGRESGSDAWKAYMRRQTCTVNYGSELPLAQGIDFGG
ncbi:MAG: aldehyde dehydrogenase family protein [Myxococcota bacterium]